MVWRHGAMVWAACLRRARPRPPRRRGRLPGRLRRAAHAARIRDRAAVAGWLHRVAPCAALDLRAARRAAGPLPDGDPPAPGPDPLRCSLDREARELIDAGLDRLPDKLRLPFVLCVLEGHQRRGRRGACAARSAPWSRG